MRFDEKSLIAVFSFFVIASAFGIGAKLVKIGSTVVDVEDFENFTAVFEKIFLLLTAVGGYVLYKNNQVAAEEQKEQEEKDRENSLRNTTRTIFSRVTSYLNEVRSEQQGQRISPRSRTPEPSPRSIFSGRSFYLPSPTVQARSLNELKISPRSKRESFSVVIDPMEVESKDIVQSPNQRRAQ